MLLVDANVFMYAAGSDHPNKPRAIRFLESVAAGETDAAVDAEVLQEILHRYRSIGRWKEGRTVYLCYDSDAATNPSVSAARRPALRMPAKSSGR